jgi:hypothetical protein
MLEPLTDLPDGVIGFEAVGEVEAADYKDLLIPAVDDAAAAGEVRLVVVLGERFKGYTFGAEWMDAKLMTGLGHLSAWKRTAVVSDVTWVSNLVAFFGWMVPGDFKRFPLAERDEAVAWAAG